MSSKANSVPSWLRWIAIAPCFVLAYGLARILYNWSLAYAYDPAIINAVAQSAGFAGHPYFGAFYVFASEATATAVSIMAAIWVAPTRKKETYYVATGVWCLLAVIGLLGLGAGIGSGSYELLSDVVVKTMIGLVGSGFGIFAGWKYLKELESTHRQQ